MKEYYTNAELETFARQVIAGQLDLDELYDDCYPGPAEHPLLAGKSDPMADVMTIDALVQHLSGVYVDSSAQCGPVYSRYFGDYVKDNDQFQFVGLVTIQTQEIVPVYVNSDGSLHAEW